MAATALKLSKKKDTNLGKKMKCIVTGFEGIATSKIEFLNGCFQYCLKPPIDEKGKMPDGEWIDVEQLELVRKTPVRTKRTNTGGDNKADMPKV